MTDAQKFMQAYLTFLDECENFYDASTDDQIEVAGG